MKPAERSVDEFLLGIFEAWERGSIPFIVLRNYESLPCSIGNDLDVLVEPRRIRDAERLLLKLATAKGWILWRCVEFSSISFWYCKLTTEEVVHVDLFRDLSWRGLEYLDAKTALARRRRSGSFYVPHPLDEASINLLMRLLEGGYVRDKYKPKIAITCLDDPGGFSETLANRFGKKMATGIVEAVLARRWKVIEGQVNRLRFHLLVHNLARKPMRFFRSVVRDISRLLRRLLRPPGSIVAIVGCDGVGKSTTIQKLLDERGIVRLFNGTALRHWRPDLLPSLGSFVNRQVTNPGVPQPPRRTPGRFQALRLVYYWIDLVLGNLLRDRPQTMRSRLLVYDRCALDMAVDPVRFGLRSLRGTMLLWKLMPKPEFIVLLFDRPERVLSRKAELSLEEIEREQHIYMRLAQEGHIHAVVSVDASPEEIARRIQDLLIGRLVRMNDSDVCTRLREDETVTELTALVCGTRLTTHAVAPSKRRPRFLIPLAPRRAAAASLKVYSPQKPLARLSKHLLGLGLRTGLAQHFLPTNRTFSVRDPLPTEESEGRSLQEHLSDILGEKNLAMAAFLGTRGPHRKPTLQLMNPRGKVLGFAKVGWNEQTIGLTRREEEVLNSLRNVRLATAFIPKVLHAGWWNGRYVLVVGGPAGSSKPTGHVLTERHLLFLRELRFAKPVFEHPVGGRFTEELQQRIAVLQERGLHYHTHLLTQALARCLDRIGDIPIQWSFKHGDFTPWNILDERCNLFVFDWEYAGESALPCWDLFHFIVQTSVLVKGLDGRRALQAVRQQSTALGGLGEFLTPAGVTQQLLGPLFFLYVVDVMSWYLCREAEASDEKGQKLRNAWTYLLTMATSAESPF